MSKPSRAALFDILNTWKVPGTQTSLVALKAVRGIDLEGGRVQLSLHLLDAYQDRAETIQQALRELMGALEGVSAVDIAFTWEKTPEPSFQDLLPTVKAAVVVGSGKGGVGKSTVAANLACAAARLGLKVGLLDADLYGPSMAMMFGIQDGPEGTPEGKILPIEKFGLKLMSMGFLIDDDRPVVWRGPMLNKALQQFLGDVLWGELDLLFIDLPPGTGDVQITLVQNAKETIAKGGAVVVSTPQDVAFLDAKKAIGLFKVVEVPILGIVENMSSFLCPHCKGETHIFGHGGVKAAAREMDLPFLGEVPIDLEIRAGSDQGTPLVVGHPDSPQAKAFLQMARELKVKLNL
ncbi:MAG: Septum site-determining protein MinD [Acidobacteria bacterium ADurb.Bin340]|nr:MAG: Septum site-determining protein MinD [Acidobacteria bacterium ADurb.Bin340]